MVTTIATVLAGLIGAAIVFLGAHDLVAPQSAATGFGLPNGAAETGPSNSQAWLSVRAVRDIASGLFIFILLAYGAPHLLGWVMLASCLIPVGDALVVRRNDGPSSAVYGVHGGTAVVMLAISVVLLAA